MLTGKLTAAFMVFLALGAGCGSESSDSVGELSIAASGGRGRAYRPPRLLSESGLLPCAEASRFADSSLLVLPTDTAQDIGRPVCYINLINGALPNRSKQWNVNTVYMPDHMSPSTATLDDVTAGGGLLVLSEWNVDESRTKATWQESDSHALVDINGEQGQVVRMAAEVVYVQWFRTDAAGRRQLVFLKGNFSPDEIVDLARSLRPGIPERERTPPVVYPGSTTTTSGESPATSASTLAADDTPANDSTTTTHRETPPEESTTTTS